MRNMRMTILAAGLFAAASPAHADWLRADTESFIIYSEGSEKSLREFAETLQRFDVTLRTLFNIKEHGEENRLPIYLLASTAEAGRLASGSRNSSIAGFYSPHPEGSFAVSHRENYGGAVRHSTSASQQTLFHEYSHHFMKRYVTAAFPAWFKGSPNIIRRPISTRMARPRLESPPIAGPMACWNCPRFPWVRCCINGRGRCATRARSMSITGGPGC